MRKVLLLFAALFVSYSSVVVSQTKFNVNVYGGYTVPLGDLDGDFPSTLPASGKLDFTDTENLFTKNGFNFGALIKYVIDSSASARLTGGLNYTALNNSIEYARPNGQRRGFNNKVNIFTFAAGIEYSFSPKKKVNPFIGLDLAANFFSGKVEGTGDTNFTITRKDEARFGFIGNLGVNFTVKNNFGFVVGVKYAVSNAIGKKTETVSTTNQNTDIEPEEGGNLNELPLNDAEAGINKSKTLNYFQVYAGISINFGDKIK
jgi:outer membrane protein W